MTVNAENMVETIRANVDNDGLTDEQFREFIRNTLPIVESGYRLFALFEIGVHGYHVRYKEFTGNFDQIKAQLREASNAFVRELAESDERNGDLRQYVPQFAEGYLKLGGFGAEQGTDFDITLMKMVRLDTDEELSYNHAFCKELRTNFGIG